MKASTKTYIILSLLLLNVFSYAQIDRTTPPEAGPAPEIKLGEYESFTLDNGLQVFVVENHKLPVVSFSLIIDRDPLFEGDSVGYTDAAGSLLMTSTTTKSKEDIDSEIDFLGAYFSTSSTGIYASSLKKYSSRLMALFADVLLNPVFKQEELNTYIQQMKSSLQASQEEPSWIADVVKGKVFYPEGHPYSETVTMESLDEISVDMCRGYYEKWFKPNISYLAVVGDITVQEAKALIDSSLGSWEKGSVEEFAYEYPELPEKTKVLLVDRPDAVQSTIMVGHPIGYRITQPDYLAGRLANTILGGGVFRLFNNLREDKAYTYGAYSSLSPDELIGEFGAYTDVRNEVTDSAITEIFYEINRLRNEPVDEEELQLAKNYLSGNFALSLESPQTIARFAINIARYNLPENFYADYLKNIQSVSAEQVLEAANTLMKPAQSYILVVGKSDEIEEKLLQLPMADTLEYYDKSGKTYNPELPEIPEDYGTENVIDKYIEAVGGREKIMGLADRTVVMNSEIADMNMKLTIYQKTGLQFAQYVEFGVSEIVTLLDSSEAWQKISGNTVKLTESEYDALLPEADLNMPLTVEAYYDSILFNGLKKVDDTIVAELVLFLPNGDKIVEWYDHESGLKLRKVKLQQGETGEVRITIEFKNYKEVDGFLYPQTIVQQTPNGTLSWELDTIQTNTGLDDKYFTKNYWDMN